MRFKGVSVNPRDKASMGVSPRDSRGNLAQLSVSRLFEALFTRMLRARQRAANPALRRRAQPRPSRLRREGHESHR